MIPFKNCMSEKETKMRKEAKLWSRVFTPVVIIVIVLAIRNNIAVRADENGDNGWKFYWSANDNYTISIAK